MTKRWALMERFEVPHFDRDDEMYLTRWRIISTPFAALFLHRIGTPDSRPTLHDHPWSFVSILLRGGYTEIRLDKHTHQLRRRYVRFVNVMRRDDAHYIERIHGGPVWSLLLVGRRRRVWGYWRPVLTNGRHPVVLSNERGKVVWGGRQKLPDETILRAHLGMPGRGQWYWTPFDRDEHAEEFDAAAARRAQAVKT